MSVERSMENEEKRLEQVESNTERLEHLLEEVNDKIAELEDALRQTHQKGDEEVEGLLEQKLAEQQHEQRDLTLDVENVQRELEGIHEEIARIDDANQETHEMARALHDTGLDVSDLSERVLARSSWIEEMHEQTRRAQDRLEGLLRDYG